MGAKWTIVERPSDDDGETLDLESLFAAQAAEAAKVDLQALYDQLNGRYFAGRLPRYTVVRDESVLRRQEEVHAAIATRLHRGETPSISGACDDFHKRITINAYAMGDELTYLLLHEMCHVEQPGRGGHGPIFRERARKVAKQAGIPLARIM
jgi:hypothetical protein